MSITSDHIWVAMAEGQDNHKTQVLCSHEPRFLEMVNEGKNAIFKTVNEFMGYKRVVGRISKLVSFFVDCDCPKEDRVSKIKILDFKNSVYDRIVESSMKTSAITETKNGLHFFFNVAKEDSSPDNLDQYCLIQDYLIKYFNGDTKCKDASRLLRAPGYKHWKDINDPFLVTEIECDSIIDKDAYYTIKQMDDKFFYVSENDIINFFSETYPDKKEEIADGDCDVFKRSEFWRVDDSLKILEGTEFLNVTLAFKKNGNGTTQLMFGGKSSGLYFFNDNPSGKNLKFWLYSYHKDWYKVRKALEYIEGRHNGMHT